MPKISYRTSYGIAMCRYNMEKNKQVEILMVKKRYTYAYFSFVFGKYKKYNNKHLSYLFNNMTFDEKITILSMKFSNMWYRLMRYDPENNYTDEQDANRSALNYFKKKTKFETIFLVDSGKRLRRFINNSFNAVTPWEIPKGKANHNEKALNCAIREFQEETDVYSDKYTIIWDAKPIIATHVDENVKYKYVYYPAYMNKNATWTPHVNFGSPSQLSEIEQVKWVSVNEIQFLNLNPTTKKHLIDTCKKITKSFKRSVKSYYYCHTV